MREPGASPGRSRRCEGRRSPATTPLAARPGRRREREPRVRRPAALPDASTPSRKGEGDAAHDTSFCPRGVPDRLRARGRARPVARGAEPARRHAVPRATITVVERASVTIRKRPSRIVSLSPTATETLFAIGAGKQVDRGRRPVRLPEDGAADDALGLHAERRGDRGLPAGPRRDLVRPEGPLGGARQARHPRRPPGRGARPCRARTSRSASSGRSRATPPRRTPWRPA